MHLLADRSRLALLALSFLLLALMGCDTSGSEAERLASMVSVSPAYLSFDGTSSATIRVTANGSWTLRSDASWLRVDRLSGSTGTTDVTVTVDRRGLAPQQYVGELTLTGAGEIVSAVVSMRFPKVTGRVVDTSGRIIPGSHASGGDVAQLAHEARDETIPGEYLVLLNDGMARALEARAKGLSLQAAAPSVSSYMSMAAALAANHGVVQASPVISAAAPIVAFSGVDPDVAARLAEDGRVMFIEPRRRLRPLPVEAAAIEIDSDFYPQWHYSDINLAEAWSLTQGDPGVVVAVVDGGFAAWDPRLASNLLPGFDFVKGVPDPSAYSACTAHGTHVAGTIASTWGDLADVGGVAPKVSLRLLRVGIENDGSCVLDDLAVYNAILYAAGVGVSGAPQIPPVDVINLSLGTYEYSGILEWVVRVALEAGVSVVAAAGNDSFDGVVMFPAAFQGVIGVSATDMTEGRAHYSNAGPQVDVAAPGGDTRYDRDLDGWLDGVISLGWDLVNDQATYVALQGTSMATPHVAGVVALMRSVNPDLDPGAVMTLVRATARDLGAPGPDPIFGWGIVDAGAAVRAASSMYGVKLSDVTVRVRRGSTIMAFSRAGPTGAFDLGQFAEGTYVLEAGTDLDKDGVIDDPGEFYGSATINVTYAGDVTKIIELDLR